MDQDLSRYKNIIFNLGVIILVLIFAGNVYKRQVKDIEVIKTTRDSEARKNEVLGNIRQKEKKINSFKNAINKKDVSLIMNPLSSIARDSSVKIISIGPQGEKDYPVYLKYSFALVVTANNYHNIGKFISKLENSGDIYIVESINIVESEGQSKEEKCKAKLRLSTILIK